MSFFKEFKHQLPHQPVYSYETKIELGEAYIEALRKHFNHICHTQDLIIEEIKVKSGAWPDGEYILDEELIDEHNLFQSIKYNKRLVKELSEERQRLWNDILALTDELKFDADMIELNK